MTRIFNAVSVAAMSAALIFSTPAIAAGKHERAQAAIAEARAKIDASAKIGASTQSPRLQADAQAALRSAEERLARGDKDEAIAAAHRASQLADTALGEAQRARTMNAQAATANARDAAADAQAQAAAANARANAAEQAAVNAQADAAIARATPAPIVMVAPPAPPTTTVTTEVVKTAPVATPRPVAKRKVVRRTVRHVAARPAPRVTTKTTTTIKTEPN